MSVGRTVPVVVLILFILAGCLDAAEPASVSSSARQIVGSRTGADPADVIQANKPAVCNDAVRGIDLQAATMEVLQTAMTQGRLTAVELVDAYYARFLAFDEAGPTLNSIQVFNPLAWDIAKQLDEERAAGNVRGPLHGIPIMLKDNIGTNDMPTTAGSIALENNLPIDDATITFRLREAGAIILGKAQLSEFANWVDLSMPSGYSSLGGQVINAYNWSRTPSGSSAGSGVLTSMAFSAGSIGSETSGSILSPSNANSNVGVKPTMGLLSRAGIIPLAENFDVPGPMVRNVYDAAAMLGAMVGEADPKDPETQASQGKLPVNNDYIAGLKSGPGSLAGVRLGYVNAGSTVFEEARKTLTELGAEVVQIQSNQLTSASTGEIGLIPQEFHQGINDYLLNTPRQKALDILAPDLGAIILFNSQHPDKVKYGQNLIIASEPNAGFGGAFVKPAVDALALPVVTGARMGADQMFDDHDVDAIIGQNAPHTGLGAAAGYPTVVVPSGYSGDGTIPVGISFFGKAFTEDKLLAYAYAYEQATHKRIPPTVQNPKNLEGVCAEFAASTAGQEGAMILSDPEFPTEIDLAREYFAGASSRDRLLELP